MLRGAEFGSSRDVAFSYTTKSGIVYTLERRVEIETKREAFTQHQPMAIYITRPDMEKGVTTVLELRRGERMM